jgi:DNA-directed RNA polymerase specialized sigma24 family protein
MTMKSNVITTRPRLATTQGIRETFSRYQTELEWLAYFITGDKMTAAACVADACALATARNQIFEDWLLHWARHATMGAAIQTLKSRVGRLSPTYEREVCAHGGHSPLSAGDVQLVVEEANLLVSRLDALSRCALVMCGIEKRSFREAALIMGVPRISVEFAYCAAIESLEVIRCERGRDQKELAAVCN